MLRLAWRNVWRNLRRSLITTSSMGLGLAAIMFGQSLIKSLQSQLVEKSTGAITGHIQIQNRQIKEYKFPDKYMDDPEPAARALAAHPGVETFGRRIHITGLVSSPTASSGVMICGVEADKEPKITSMASYLVKGEFLGKGSRGIVMGDKLAQRLDLRMGEKAVVMAQAEDGSMGAEAFRLVGIYHSGSESFDGQIIYIPLAGLQEITGVGAKLNNFVARVKDINEVDRVAQELRETLAGKPVQVLTWKQVDHEIVSVQEFQNAILDVVLVVVFFIVSLGILNTLLMSFFERVREFGVLMAIGARPSWVMTLVLLESATLGVAGTLFGLTVGCFMIVHFGRAGLHLPVGDALSYFIPFPSVIYMHFSWGRHAVAALSVLVTALLSALPPALRAGRLKPAEALRHV